MKLSLCAFFGVALITGCGAGASDARLGSSASHLDEATSPITNFHVVVDGAVYRGAHPSASDLDWLKQAGVKTILDLEVGDFVEAYPWDITAEENAANDRGFAFIRKPMSAFEPALSSGFDRQMDEILAILRDPAQQPVFVHCLHGQDRTGLVIGLERVLNEGWAPQTAYDEMLADGFHTMFLGLNHYFETKTGWDD